MGSSVSAGVGVGIRPSSLSDATNSPIATNPRVLNVVDDMSGAQLVRMKNAARTCSAVKTLTTATCGSSVS